MLGKHAIKIALKTEKNMYSNAHPNSKTYYFIRKSITVNDLTNSS